MTSTLFNSGKARIRVQSKDDISSEDVVQTWTSVHRAASLSRSRMTCVPGGARMYRRLSVSKPKERNG